MFYTVGETWKGAKLRFSALCLHYVKQACKKRLLVSLVKNEDNHAAISARKNWGFMEKTRLTSWGLLCLNGQCCHERQKQLPWRMDDCTVTSSGSGLIDDLSKCRFLIAYTVHVCQPSVFIGIIDHQHCTHTVQYTRQLNLSFIGT